MIALPAFLGVASRFLRRGSIYFLPPIRFNMPVNVNNSHTQQLMKVGSRVFTPEEIRDIHVEYEFKWPGLDFWVSHDEQEEKFSEITAEKGQPIKRVFGAHLTLKDSEVLWLDARKYWKLQGVIMQIGIEI